MYSEFRENQRNARKTPRSPPHTMTPKYELTYFNFRGRAELARLILAVAGIDYEDKRITKVEDWLEMKASLPFRQLPILRVGEDFEICQSHAIARFLAKDLGLAGSSKWEEAQADMVVDCVIDMMDPIQPCFREKDIKKKEEMRHNYEELLPGFLSSMEDLLKRNKQGQGYFVGDELTWADLAVMNAWHWIPGFGIFPKIHEYPLLDEHRKRIEAHPRIQAWMEKRPDTPV